MTYDLSIRIGGDAGQGVESSGAGFCKALARAGLHVFANGDYRSRIRGGHNFFQVRVGTRPVYAPSEPPQVLVALTRDTLERHQRRLGPGAGVLYDESFGVKPDDLRALDLYPMPLPLNKMATAHGTKMMANTAGLGALAGILGFPLEHTEDVIRENFSRKGAEIVEANLGVVRDAYAYGQDRYGAFPLRLPAGDGRRRMLIHGNHAIALGAIAGGCRFISAYPMTPATTIIEHLARVGADFGVVTKHTEDEIAAICMAIGASFAGARSMTATSGGGFSLMAEALGLAGMTEVPIVIVDAQRGGPSTGLPTRTEQSDLVFAIHASHGEFPRFVLAPGSVEECFEAGWRAFNLADQYQSPVIILTDTLLAGSLRTVDPEVFDFASVEIDRGAVVTSENLEPAIDHFRRYALTASGISPRGFPGDPQTIFSSSTDEHDEEGHITEEIPIRVQMMRKRMRKEETALRQSIRPPARYGPPEPDVTLVCWGSTLGAVREAAERLSAAGQRIGVLHFHDVWPMNEQAVSAALAGAGLTIGVEQNYTAQLARVIRMATGRRLDRQIVSYSGRPYSTEEVMAAVTRAIAGEREIHVAAGDFSLPRDLEVRVHA